MGFISFARFESKTSFGVPNLALHNRVQIDFESNGKQDEATEDICELVFQVGAGVLRYLHFALKVHTRENLVGQLAKLLDNLHGARKNSRFGIGHRPSLSNIVVNGLVLVGQFN